MSHPSGPNLAGYSAFTQALQAPHDTLPELHTKLTATTNALPSVGLENTVPFAHAYSEITGRANQALEAGAFTDPDSTVRLASNFAGLYFDALSSQVSSIPEVVAPSWRQLFESESTQPPWLLLALGVNAHIGHDLPFALQSTDLPRDFRTSYVSLNRAIKTAAPLLAPAFLPNIAATPRHAVASVAASTIVRWRGQAWKHFEQLMAQTTTPAVIEAQAARRGEKLISTSRILGAVGLNGVSGTKGFAPTS